MGSVHALAAQPLPFLAPIPHTESLLSTPFLSTQYQLSALQDCSEPFQAHGLLKGQAALTHKAYILGVTYSIGVPGTHFGKGCLRD